MTKSNCKTVWATKKKIYILFLDSTDCRLLLMGHHPSLLPVQFTPWPAMKHGHVLHHHVRPGSTKICQGRSSDRFQFRAPVQHLSYADLSTEQHCGSHHGAYLSSPHPAIPSVPGGSAGILPRGPRGVQV